MLNICNNSKCTKYINWIPSEAGPLISAYGSINNSISIKNDIIQIYDSINDMKPAFNLSVSHSLVDINLISYPNEISDKNYIEWQLKYLYGVEYSSFDHYQYILQSSKNNFLNISIKKIIKANIFPEDMINIDMRSLSVDIFSAECGARHWFKAEGNYVIWKVGNRNYGNIMIINNNNLSSLFSIKIKNKKYLLQSVLLNSNIAEDFINYINNLLEDSDNAKNIFGTVYFYNGGCGRSVFNFFLKLKNKNFYPLNPFDVIKTSVKAPNGPYIGTSYAETGIGFSGLDV